MLIKLESGDYVDTYYVERLWMVNEHDGYIRFANNRFANNPDVQITKSDFGLIVKAMEPNYLEEYDDALPDDLPVIPEVVGKYLKMWKHDYGDLFQAFDEGTSTSLDGTKWESVQDWFIDTQDRFDIFARAWLLGVWRVEETGEVVKLEAEK